MASFETQEINDGSNNKVGYLTLIMGCMFAQKTTEILKRIRRYESIGYKVLVINFHHDTRYGNNCISSHDIDQHPARALGCLEDLSDDDIRKYNVIVIDEGQFFPDLYSTVTDWADRLPIHIVVSGLDGDSERRPFGDLLRLIPHAEEVVRLNAYCSKCRDGTIAHFSCRLKACDEQVSIGAADQYLPMCRRHYLLHKDS
jgi:thymidine kinase